MTGNIRCVPLSGQLMDLNAVLERALAWISTAALTQENASSAREIVSYLESLIRSLDCTELTIANILDRLGTLQCCNRAFQDAFLRGDFSTSTQGVHF
jgi:hypothetical protein